MLLLAVAGAAGPAADGSEPTAEPRLILEVRREVHTLELDVALEGPLPAELTDTLPSGTPVSITYALRVRGDRRMWWDRRVWRGGLVTTAAFDPVTGRFRCEAVLDGAIVAAQEASGVAEAVAWLRDPPPVRVVIPERAADNRLEVRARGVFSSSTVWLVFPSIDGTDWVKRPVTGPDESPSPTPSPSAVPDEVQVRP